MFNRPDIVVYNEELKTVSLLELNCPFIASHQHRKEGKPEYQQIVAELDKLGFVSQCHTVEIGLPWPLGHYLNETIMAMENILKQSFSHSKTALDRAAATAITTSQRISFACNNPTWTN